MIPHPDPATEPPNTAIYARMSKDADLDGLGVERQLADCRAEADKRGWPVTAEFIDNDVSATNKRKPRPQYQRLITAIKTGQIHALVVWDVDRLTRTPRELEDIIDLADNGLQLASCGGFIDLGTPQGRMTAGIKAQVARHEVDQLKRRMGRSLAQRATSGKAHGRAPYGWRPADPAAARVKGGRAPDELDTEPAEVIRDTAARLLAGDSMRSVVADLNKRGVPATRGGKWATQSLRTIMLRDRNAGIRMHRGQEMEQPGDWPVMYDRDVHDRLVALLTDPQRNTGGGAPPRHLLSKIAVCGKCGGPMTSNPGRPVAKSPTKRVKAPGYCCMSCFGVRRSQAPVDNMINELMIARLEQPDAVDLLATHGDPDEVRRQRALAAGLEAKMLRGADDYADEKITHGQLMRLNARLQPQLKAAQAAVRAALPRAEMDGLVGPQARVKWGAASLDVRRAVIRALLVSVTIQPSGPGRRPFDPGLIEIVWNQADQNA